MTHDILGSQSVTLGDRLFAATTLKGKVCYFKMVALKLGICCAFY